jgi:hypothetical protein
MQRRLLVLGLASLLVLMTGGVATLFAQQAPPERPRPKAPAMQQASGAVDVQAATGSMAKTRSDFYLLLRNHPRLVGVFYHDPSLLGDLDYVKKNGPDLAAFVEQHPEVAQNPEFFLGEEVQRMHDSDTRTRNDRESASMRIMDDVWPFMVFVIVTGVLMWLIKVFLENRRWGRIAKVQAEVHAKLMDKFSSSQDLQAYMQTEAGKRFLESAPIPVEPDQKIRMSAPLGRILWSVQVGLILAMGGIALLFVRSNVPEGVQPLTVFGTLGLMLGLGFVLSAGAAYVLSRHLGLFESARSGPAT